MSQAKDPDQAISEATNLLQQAGMGQQPGKGNCVVDMVREACERIAELERAVRYLQMEVKRRAVRR